MEGKLHRSQERNAAKKANSILGCVTQEAILALYLALARPHLTDWVQLRALHFLKDVNKLARLQRRVTRMIRGLENETYTERMEELG